MQRPKINLSITVAALLVSQFFLASCSAKSAESADVGTKTNGLEAAEAEQYQTSIEPLDLAHFYPSPLDLGYREIAKEQAKLMEQAARIGPGSKVLEIGTGSGYQAAYFSSLGARVYSVEIVDNVAEVARKRLNAAGVDDVQIKVGDGWQGWAEHAPYDSIVVRPSSPSVPKLLLQQLANRGRLVVPIDSGNEKVTLVVERVNQDFVTHFRDFTVSSKLLGEARTEAPTKLQTPSGFSLIQKLISGEQQ